MQVICGCDVFSLEIGFGIDIKSMLLQKYKITIDL